MKKIARYSLAAALLVLMVLSAAGCGKKEKTPQVPALETVQAGQASQAEDISQAASSAQDGQGLSAVAQVNTQILSQSQSAQDAVAVQEAAQSIVLAEPGETAGPDAISDLEEVIEDTPAVSPAPSVTETPSGLSPPAQEPQIDEDGSYTTKDDVALYLHTYGHLPGNFITKKEAGRLGWTGGSLEPYAPGKCIGGDYFGNYDRNLPAGVKYRECDIGTLGRRSRGAKRIIYGSDGSIWYTDDHYESFTRLY